MLILLAKRRSRTTLVAGLILALASVEAITVGAVYWSERSGLRATEAEVVPGDPSVSWFSFSVPPIVRPEVVAADRAGLDDAEDVIGVEVGGKARAYRLSVLRDRDHHIVNDVVGGVPVSVAYCDLTDCVQGYTDAEGSAPLDLAIAGLHAGEMVVRTRGDLFLQRTGEGFPKKEGEASIPSIPLKGLETVRTTWKEWKARHPSGEVYEGGPAGNAR